MQLQLLLLIVMLVSGMRAFRIGRHTFTGPTSSILSSSSSSTVSPSFGAGRRGIHRSSAILMSVKPMNVVELEALLKSPESRARVQIIDVREDAELVEISLRDPAVIHLPLSRAAEWSPQVEAGGGGLEKDKAQVCICKAGVRSAKMANFLVSQGFGEVYNLEGGMIRIAEVSPAITSL